MRSKAIRAGRGSIAVGLAAMVLLIARTYVSPSVVVAKEPNAAHNVAAQSAGEMQQLPAPISASQMQVWPGDGVVAGTLPGEPVYSNEIPSIATFFPGSSGAGRRLADDLELAGGACDVAYFDLAVVGLSGAETTFSVNVALWNGDPCAVGSTIILGTEFNVPNIPADGIPKLLSFTVNPVIPIPAKVWLAATFTDPAIPIAHPSMGWIVAERAETGFTGDFFSYNGTGGCGLYGFSCSPLPCTPRYGGFWANIRCMVPPPQGACCNGTTCSQTTEADCPLQGGIWQGAFSTCVPNVCLTGTCCRGDTFSTCTDTSEAGCQDGVFNPGATCGVEGCAANFKVYENDFRTGVFTPVDAGTKFGDDFTFAPGPPCDLHAYDVTVFGDPNPTAECLDAPDSFNATLELWTYDDRGTPSDATDDIPGVPIPGTLREFPGIAADFIGHRLLAGAFEGVTLPERAWVVLSTSSCNAGPGLGGMADIGVGNDSFAIFNLPSAPGTWSPGLFFGGFNPDTCPGGANCTPAGSFRANVWCAGTPPTGACCDRVAGTCTEGVTSLQCQGRWVMNGTCDPGTFDPPCGAHACCFRFPLNPTITVCSELTRAECDAESGFLSVGKFCGEITCPDAVCMEGTGDCLSAHPSANCENPFCACAVCAQPNQDVCCTGVWDSQCAEVAALVCTEFLSNDLCDDAKSISGQGTFNFDNSAAATDGLAHAACTSGGTDLIEHDLWFRWTSPCTDTVFVRTCGQAGAIDTKLAVYDGVACLPGDDALLDCDDDRCYPASMTTFEALGTHEYLIRLGTYPGSAGGAGTFSISCGPPNVPACTGATGDCCVDHAPAIGCANERCCESVCACDDYCCTVEWDNSCATVGANPNCGAGSLCPQLCGPNCPLGTVSFVDPAAGAVDARRSFDPLTGTPLLGVDTIYVNGPPGAVIECWSLCETASTGTANTIAGVTEVAGAYTITLGRPMTPGAVTRISYTNFNGAATAGHFTTHPGNANGDGTANAGDASALVAALGGGALPWGMLSKDIDHSGAFTPMDLLDAVNLLAGSGAYPVWNNTSKPAAAPTCP
ncbi:MAG: hypothetical protein AABZ12_14475 [Planctomycetota bacterium]